jgi:hypothetical protein
MLDKGILGPAPDGRVPYFVIVSTFWDMLGGYGSDLLSNNGLNVNTTGIEIHGIDFIQHDIGYYEINEHITNGDAMLIDHVPIIPGLYPGHFVPYLGTYSYYKGSYSPVKSGVDLHYKEAGLLGQMRAAGYNAVVTDQIGDGFVLDTS